MTKRRIRLSKAILVSFYFQDYVQRNDSLIIVRRLVLQKNTQLQLTASFWKLFKILVYEILEAKFGFRTKTFV